MSKRALANSGQAIAPDEPQTCGKWYTRTLRGFAGSAAKLVANEGRFDSCRPP